MNRYIAQGDGFPADNEFLMMIQAIIGEVAQLSALGGSNYILKGCEAIGGVITAGVIVIDGEILEFTESAPEATITIIQNVENATYLEDLDADGQGDSKQTYFFRTAKMGTGGESTYNWEDFTRVQPLVDIQKAITPVGAIVMWAGDVAAIPSGWALCNGSNGTPNLSGKFIAGYSASDTDHNAIAKQGGAKEVTLSEAQMPSHNHTGSLTIPPHYHGLKDGDGGTDTNSVRGNSGNSPNVAGQDAATTFVKDSRLMQSDGGGTYTITTTTKGGGAAHENRPPFYTLAYIQYKGV